MNPINKKALVERVVRRVKGMLTEGVSSRVYHFTSLDNMIRIMETDQMCLQSSVAGNGSDNYGGRMFYMSLTRNRNTNMSYAHNYSYRKGGARIEFDADKLNQNFKGMSVDYWGDMGKQGYYNTDLSYGEKRVHDRNEMEDRILSDKSVIDNVHRYIKRVDIFALDEESMKYARYAVSMWYGRVFVYDNLKDFNQQNGNTINDNLIGDGGETPQIRRQRHYGLTDALENFFKILCWQDVIDGTDWKTKVAKMMKSYGLERRVNGELFREISKLGWSMAEIGSSLSNNMHDLSREPSQEGHIVLQMISDYLRRNGCRSLGEWVRSLTPKKPEYDYDKEVAAVVFRYKDDTDGIINVSLDFKNESFWKFIECDSYESRMWFLDKIYERRESHYDNYVHDYVEASYQHNSKSDKHFYKYLQNLAHSEPTVYQMVGILKKLNIPLDDEELFGGCEIAMQRVNYFRLRSLRDDQKAFFQK